MSNFAWDKEGNLYALTIIGDGINTEPISTFDVSTVLPLVPVEDLPEIFTNIKLDMGITNTDQDAIILRHINRVARKIMNYCNLKQVPQGLYIVLEEKVVSLLRSGNSGTIIEGTGAIKRVSRGDTTIEYDVGSTVIGGDSYTRNLLDDVTSQLNAYRKVKW